MDKFTSPNEEVLRGAFGIGRGRSTTPETHVEAAPLSTRQRKNLDDSQFVFPDTREYPIDTIERARDALSRGAANESGARLAKIRQEVKRKYPSIDVSNGS